MKSWQISRLSILEPFVMITTPPSQRSPSTFVALVLLLSVPLWLLGSSGGSLSAGPLAFLPAYLPVSALIFVCPLVAVVILEYGADGIDGIPSLLKRIIHPGGIEPGVWYVPIVLLMPTITLLTYGVVSLARLPHGGASTSVLAIPILLVAFFIAAIFEEVGWTGYATDPLQERWGALGAALILGAIHAIYHVVPLIEANHAWDWIAWWAVGTVSNRVVTVWLYNNTGKVLAAILFHAVLNVSYALVPDVESAAVQAIWGILLAISAATVTGLWGARTLAHYRNALAGAHQSRRGP
jgi:membrane protease YdiL (CAAX protease family)